MERIRLFHATSDEAAAAILESGFKDSIGPCALGPTGIFVASSPLDGWEGAKGRAVLEIVIESTPEQMFYEWEVVDQFAALREWIIPAEFLNRFPVRLLTADEVDSVQGFWNGYPPGEPHKTYAELDEDPIGE